MSGLLADVARMRRGHRWGARPPMPDGAREHRLPVPAREFPTAWSRSPAARALRAGIQGAGLVPVVRSQTTLQVRGGEVLDALGDAPVVFVANHASHLDTAAFVSALPPHRRARLGVAAAADYFFDAWWRGAGTALLFATVPVERRGGAPAQTPAELLAAGWSLLIFPEGTRSPDGALQRFKTGAVRLAQEAGVPLVPVGIVGTYRAMPRGRSWPVPGRPQVTIRFGTPVADADASPKELTDRLRRDVVRLLDEERTDWWTAARAAHAAPAPAAPRPARWRAVWEATAPPPDRRDLPRVWR